MSNYGADWQRLRARFLEANPTCVDCGSPADTVDHIQPVKLRPDLRLDPANLRPMCKRCHDRHTIHAQGLHRDRPRKPIGARADGLPTDPDHPWR